MHFLAVAGIIRLMKLIQFKTNTIIAFIVSLALFMDSLDTTIINTAVPSMASSLSVSPVDLKVALISYLISLAIFIPISGWIGDKFGAKRVFITAIIIFTLSSLWCGMSHSLTQLVIARSCQGLGGSLMIPLGRLIILQTFKRHELVEAMNAVVMVVSLGLMLGPLAGGFITEHLSWEWIFWVNIPIGLFAIVMSSLYLRESPPRKVKPLDVPGFILFGGGLAGLTFALSNFSESQADPSRTWIIFLSSLGMLISYAIYSLYQKSPIIDSSLFRIRTFRVSMLCNLIARIGFGGIPFLIPLMLQVVMGYSPQVSGLLIMPMAIGVFVIKLASIYLLRIFGYKRLLITNTFFVGLIIWSYQLIDLHTSPFVIAAMTFMFGFLISLQFSSMNSMAYADISAEQLSNATVIASTMQQICQSFGVATSALLLRLYAPSVNNHMVLNLQAFHHTFLTLGIITVLSVFVILQLHANDGHQMLAAPANDEVLPD